MIRSKQLIDAPYTTLLSDVFVNTPRGWTAELFGAIGSYSVLNRSLAVEQTSGFGPGPGYVLGNVSAGIDELGPLEDKNNVVFEMAVTLDQTHTAVPLSSTAAMMAFIKTDGAGNPNFMSQPVYAILNSVADGLGDADVYLIHTDGFGSPDVSIPLGKLSTLSPVLRVRLQLVRSPSGVFDLYVYLNDKVRAHKVGLSETSFGFDVGYRPAVSVSGSQAGFVHYFKGLRLWQLPPGGGGGGGGGGITLPVGWTAEVVDDTGVSGTAILRVTTAGSAVFETELTDLAYDTRFGYEIGFETSEGW